MKEQLTNRTGETMSDAQKQQEDVKKVVASHRRSSPDVVYFTGRNPQLKQPPENALPEWMKSSTDYQDLKLSQHEIITQFNKQLTALEKAIKDEDRDAIDAIASHLCQASESINSASLMRNAIRMKLIAYSTTLSDMQSLAEEMSGQINTLQAHAG